MTESEQQVVELLRALPPESRDRVIASVGGVDAEGFAPGYSEIIERRVEEIKSGKVECRPHSELMGEMRKVIADG